MDIFEKSREKIIIVAHRGSAMGNIPCNTIPAYNAALAQGADMIEIDVDKSADDELFIFHPSMEKRHLGYDGSIQNLTRDEIAKLRYLNYDRNATQFPLNTLDEIFEEFKGRCFINVDKFWGNPVLICNAIKRHNIMDQILVKSSMSDKVLRVLQEVAPDVAFMPIVKNTHPMHEMLLSSGINYVGAEILFDTDNEEVVSDTFVEKMHKAGKLIWTNSIIYDVRAQIAAGHSDDTAICGDTERGWAWHVRHGVDIIQTDWTGMLSAYLASQGLLYRR